MTRYILIDRNSGYIWGDTAGYGPDRSPHWEEWTPIHAARVLDLETNFMVDGDPQIEYEETPRSQSDATYDVYRADIGGSDAVPIVTDGQDQQMIEAVERDCRFVTSVRRYAV